MVENKEFKDILFGSSLILSKEKAKTPRPCSEVEFERVKNSFI